MTDSNYIWYACYGSNLNYNRFMCYIEGGKAAGNSKTHIGCRDKTPPQKSDKMIIWHELFFARNSESWGGGGVAFVNPSGADNHQSTICRTYLISKQQFEDVFRQENGIQLNESIEFAKTVDGKTLQNPIDTWYPVLLFLGYKDNYPIYTITCNKPIAEPVKPSENYLLTVIKGLKEINIESSEIINYLADKKGVMDNYSASELLALMDKM